MSRTTLDFLWTTVGPWIYAGQGEAERNSWAPSHFYTHDGVDVCVRRLRGWKMRTVSGLMSEVGAALQFFDGFGENWYALEEALCYVDEWLPADAYVIVVERAEEVLAGDGEQMRAFLTTVSAAGKFWSQPVESPERYQRGPVPFHVLLNVSAELLEAATAIADAAAVAGVPLRTHPSWS